MEDTMPPLDKGFITLTNRINVLRSIISEKTVFKADIARKLGLSQPTVMKIIDDMGKKGLVNFAGKGVSSGGKPPTMLEFNQNARNIIGVDVNEYRIEAVRFNLGLQIIDKRIQDIRTTDTAKTITGRIVDEIKWLLAKTETDQPIIGIGIGVPGIVDTKNGIIIYSAEMSWHNVNLLSAMRDVFDGHIVIEDSTRAIAMGESLIGDGSNAENFLCVNVGKGISSALVLNRKLYYGSSDSAGQLGHMLVERNGNMCDCGSYGCLETYSSGNAIEKKAKELVLGGAKTLIRDLVYGNAEKIDIYMVFEAAQNGDRVALEIVETAADYLAMAITSVINQFDPDLIVFEGKVCRIGRLFVQLLEKQLANRKSRYLSGQARIVVLDNKRCTGSTGAAAFILDHFVNSGGVDTGFVSCIDQ